METGYKVGGQCLYGVTEATQSTQIMTTKQLLLHELTMLQAHKDNLIKATSLMNDEWDKSITLDIASGIDTVIANTLEIIKQLK